MSYCAHCGAKLGDGYNFCPACGKPTSGPQAQGASPPPHARSKSGIGVWMIVVIVLMCMLFFFSIIAAIAVPNLLNAIQRGKQKRTMADMRSLGKAMGTYEIDHSQYPFELSDLQSGYLKNPPLLDAWGNPWVTTFGPREYTIVSLGKNGTPDGEAFYGGTTSTFNDDIVFSSGKFTQYPDGKQTNH